ncbi:hypothetical protein EON64_04425 [archaeon]|nr:MAG: hypothetical protein EON64_04425 [archaeon]
MWSSDQAEEIKEQKQVRPMDEDQLGRFEEDVRSLVNLMQSSRPKVCIDMLYICIACNCMRRYRLSPRLF